MTVERMHVIHALHLTGRDRCTAYAAAVRDTHTGDFALERAEHQRLVFEQVETRPVHALKAFEEQRAGIRERREKTGFPCHKGLKIAIEFRVKLCFVH